MPKRSQKGGQNEVKIGKKSSPEGVLGEVRSRIRNTLEKVILLNPLRRVRSHTIAAHFSLFPSAPKSLQNCGQKLSKLRPDALKNLSGEGLKKVFKTRAIFSPRLSSTQEARRKGKFPKSCVFCGAVGSLAPFYGKHAATPHQRVSVGVSRPPKLTPRALNGCSGHPNWSKKVIPENPHGGE